MYVPLSSSKRDFFWNCIKAMSVNRIFPKFLVSFCKKNEIFKKYPKVLFLFAGSYIRLFINFRFKWKKGSLIFIKKIPVNYSGSIVYTDSDIIDNNFITGRARWLHRNPIIAYIFFLYLT